MKAKITEDEFIRLFPLLGASELARRIGTDQRKVLERRRAIEKRNGIILDPPGKTTVHHPAIQKIEIENGIVIAASDAHYWPGPPSTAHRALLETIKELKPALMVANGDMFDGATISRFTPINFEQRPTVYEELEAVKGRLSEIEIQLNKNKNNASKIWCLGNHCLRFETYLASNSPQYEKVHGTSLKDHFPAWTNAWATHINNNTVIKHRFKGGQHAPFTNVTKAGWNIITGHLHSQKVYPITNYNGTLFGCDSGCVAAVGGPQFENYTEASVTDWRSGFAIAHFHKSTLVDIELVRVLDEERGLVVFRGKVIEV